MALFKQSRARVATWYFSLVFRVQNMTGWTNRLCYIIFPLYCTRCTVQCTGHVFVFVFVIYIQYNTNTVRA